MESANSTPSPYELINGRECTQPIRLTVLPATDNWAVVAPSSVFDWIAEIKKVWARGPASTLELARIVSTARNALEHGDWSALWTSSKMPFCKRTGYLLVAVGNGLGWANVRVCAHLPTALRTLSHLARLDRATLERLIEAGRVRPALKEAEARELVARFTGKRTATKTSRAKIRHWVQRSGKFVCDNQKDWQPKDRHLAIDGLFNSSNRLPGKARLNLRRALTRSAVQQCKTRAPSLCQFSSHPPHIQIERDPSKQYGHPMKSPASLSAAMLLLSVSAKAQVSLPAPSSTPVVVEVGPHHRVWQRVTIDESGNTVTNSYTELATGMHHWNQATRSWSESKELFQIRKDGHAVETNGQHKVILAP